MTKILAHPLGSTRRPITLRNHIPKICIFLTGAAYAPCAICMATSLAETQLSDVTESMVTIRSPFCGYNTTWVELNGEDLSRRSNKIECQFKKMSI